MSNQLEKEEIKQVIEPPAMWNVIIHNDDFSHVEFVIVCLMDIFLKSKSEAIKIAMSVHEQGKGIAGKYTRDVAETKKGLAEFFAKINEQPLKFSLQKA